MTTDQPMQLGMIGLGRMGANLVRRLMRDGHRCVVYDRSAASNRDADHHRRKLIHRAARWDFLDDVFRDGARYRRALHIDERSFGGDLDGFCELTDFEAEIKSEAILYT